MNRALSAANACLYGVCHTQPSWLPVTRPPSASSTGKMLSFVYDIADLYKTKISIPAAFAAAAEGNANIESRVRAACHDLFYRRKFLQRIVPDNSQALADEPHQSTQLKVASDSGSLVPSWLWDPEAGHVSGGAN